MIFYNFRPNEFMCVRAYTFASRYTHIPGSRVLYISSDVKVPAIEPLP